VKYNISPVPKPRMTRRDKWNPSKSAKRYFSFKDEIRLLGMHLPASNSHVIFTVKMPKSWPKKKRERMNNQPHTQTPDVDNFCKALMDAVHDQDNFIFDIRISKYWGFEGAITINGIQETMQTIKK